VSGDHNREADGVCVAFEPLRCHGFITENPFGLPVFPLASAGATI
jgi:putative mRNA 3-end processing factor